jgi:hypothetical protein
MTEKHKRKTISFTVDAEDYEEILDYARIKGHGGQFPTSTFAHYAVFQMIKKYPLSEAERSKNRERHSLDFSRSMAAQPDVF